MRTKPTKIALLLLAAAMLVAMCFAGAASAEPSGNWIDYADTAFTTDNITVEGDVFTIKTAYGLGWMAKDVNAGNNASKTWILADDIDLGDHYWTPIGTSNKQFKSAFNGQYHTISNLFIKDDGYESSGLFGHTASGSLIGNVILTNVSVSGSGYSGSLIGNGKSTVSNCTATGSVRSESSGAGGLIGYSEDGLVSNCSSSCSVAGFGTVGGLIGATVSTSSQTVSNCYATGDVYGELDEGGEIYVGGLIGTDITGSLSVINCYATGNVTGYMQDPSNPSNGYVGGLIGYLPGENMGVVRNSLALNPSINGTVVEEGQGEVYIDKVIGCLDGGTTDGIYAWKYTNLEGWESGSVVSVDIHLEDVWNTFPGSFWTDKGFTSAAWKANNDNDKFRLPVLAWMKEGDSSADASHLDPVLEVATADELMAVAAKVNGGDPLQDKTVIIIADIDLAEYEWTPIGTFNGNFTGNYHTISNLHLNSNAPSLGFFGDIYGDNANVIENLILKNISIRKTENEEGGEIDVGGLIGSISVGYDNVSIRNCSVSGRIEVTKGSSWAHVYCGGLIGATHGWEYGVSLTNCSSAVNITETVNQPDSNSEYSVGGLVGESASVLEKIINCHATGDINLTVVQPEDHSYFNVGGLVGNFNSAGGIITGCFATGNVAGNIVEGDRMNYCLGGLVGRVDPTAMYGLIKTISNCYATGNVTGNLDTSGQSDFYIGGLIGLHAHVLTNCYATGQVKGTINCSETMMHIYPCNIGGLAGGYFAFDSSYPFTNSFALNPSLTAKTPVGYRTFMQRLFGGKELIIGPIIDNDWGWKNMLLNGNPVIAEDTLNGTNISSASIWGNLTTYQNIWGAANISAESENADTPWVIDTNVHTTGWPLPYLSASGKPTDAKLIAGIQHLKPITVVYDGNGGSGTAPVDTNGYSVGDNITVKDQGRLSKSGYAFDGWRYAGQTYAKGDLLDTSGETENATITLTARWKFAPSSSSSNGGATVILTETPTQVPTATPTAVATIQPVGNSTMKPTTAKPTTSRSPAPLAGLIAGLGAAALFLRPRK